MASYLYDVHANDVHANNESQTSRNSEENRRNGMSMFVHLAKVDWTTPMDRLTIQEESKLAPKEDPWIEIPALSLSGDSQATFSCRMCGNELSVSKQASKFNRTCSTCWEMLLSSEKK